MKKNNLVSVLKKLYKLLDAKQKNEIYINYIDYDSFCSIGTNDTKNYRMVNR